MRNGRLCGLQSSAYEREYLDFSLSLVGPCIGGCGRGGILVCRACHSAGQKASRQYQKDRELFKS